MSAVRETQSTSVLEATHRLNLIRKCNVHPTQSLTSVRLQVTQLCNKFITHTHPFKTFHSYLKLFLNKENSVYSGETEGDQTASSCFAKLSPGTTYKENRQTTQVADDSHFCHPLLLLQAEHLNFCCLFDLHGTPVWFALFHFRLYSFLLASPCLASPLLFCFYSSRC